MVHVAPKLCLLRALGCAGEHKDTRILLNTFSKRQRAGQCFQKNGHPTGIRGPNQSLEKQRCFARSLDKGENCSSSGALVSLGLHTWGQKDRSPWGTPPEAAQDHRMEGWRGAGGEQGSHSRTQDAPVSPIPTCVRKDGGRDEQ